MSDIVERLGAVARGTTSKPIGDREWCIDAVYSAEAAAAEINRLRSLVEEAGKVVEPLLRLHIETWAFASGRRDTLIDSSDFIDRTSALLTKMKEG